MSSDLPSSPTSTSADASVARPWYRREPGLALCLAAFVPVLLVLVLPPTVRVPLFAIAAVLAVAGLVLIVRHEMARAPRVPTSRDD